MKERPLKAGKGNNNFLQFGKFSHICRGTCCSSISFCVHVFRVESQPRAGSLFLCQQ
jgi:hypothetical protein